MNKTAYYDAVFAAAARQHVTPRLIWHGDKLQMIVPPGFNYQRFEIDLGKRLKARLEVVKTTHG